MVKEVTIENDKSIQSLTLPLGRVTVLIGENGCGKFNILEAIAWGIAAAQWELSEDLVSLGYGQSWLSNLISAGECLILLGQT